MNPILIDIGACCEHHTNEALEHLYKAIGEGPPDDIWTPHQSPLVRRLVELFTQRGLDRLAAVREGILKWQSGAGYVPGIVPPVAPGMMLRWSPEERALVKLYLESLPPAQWTIDDHMMSIDLVVQTYLPLDAIQTEAEWLAVRAGMMGKVQANLASEPDEAHAEHILEAMPSTVAGAVQQFGIAGAVRRSLDFARVRACENVRALAEGVRHKMRVVVAQDLEQRATGSVPPGTSSLQTKLLDEFGILNRDWRRIAVTEAGEAQTQGFVAALPIGAKVRRVEQYHGACSFCRKIDGVVMEVVDPSDPNKDPDTQVWVGKNNIGRSASPRRRQAGTLIERQPDEMWQIPAGLVHPHCRGRWLHEDEASAAGDDPEFAAELALILGKK